MSTKKVVIVTGGNRGIGFYICKNLGAHENTEIILTSRKKESGVEAQRRLKEEFGVNVTPLELDITSDSSISSFKALIAEKYGKIDVLINNAGVSHMSTEEEKSFREKTNYETSKKNIDTNYLGTVNITESLLPYLITGGRIIFVSSMGGIMVAKNMTEELRSKYFSCSTKEEITKMTQTFLEHVQKGDYYEKKVGYDPGYPYLSYGVSKLATNLYMKVLSNNKVIQQNEIFVCSMHPGHVATRLTSLSPYQKR